MLTPDDDHRPKIPYYIFVGLLLRIAKRLQRLSQRKHSQTPCPLQARRLPSCTHGSWCAAAAGQHLGWAPVIPPLAETAPQVPWNSLQDDCGYGNEWPVFHARGENGILLCEVECIVERGILRLCLPSNDDVHLEEGIEDVDLGGGEV